MYIILVGVLSLTLLMVFASIADIKACDSDRTSLFRERIRYVLKFGVILSTVYVVFVGGVGLSISYKTYLDTRTFYSATLEQYASAVEIYEDKAVIDIGSAALTDLKYQGYQNNVSKFILSLREGIIYYNRTIISKRVMKKNPVFSWLIVAPDDDMKIIKMKTALIKVINK